ncbi:response regulator, partial [Poseidonibacter sp.]|uniref:response regulator n=1 Tax=Poseidonibacter sp. TaxID=2321188 RepID=UPI003C73FBD0
MQTKHSILIIDDETEILTMLNRFLARSGKYDVTTYSNPLLALDTLKNRTYDIVLLDIMMPQMNGLD